MDPLEQRIREGLRPERWRVDPDPSLLARVYEGAARRRRRRATAAGAGLVTVLVVAFGGIGYGVLTNQSDTVASGGSAAQDQPAPAFDGGHRRAEKQGAESPVTARQEADKPTSDKGAAGPDTSERSDVGPTAALGDPGVPAGFRPLSFTAASAQTYWLLGEADGRATVASTTDGGETFQSVPGPPAPVARDLTTMRSDTVHSMRFAADGRTGWAYGGALWSTRDGGRTWKRENIPGQVVHLEIGGGAGYALVESAGQWTLWQSILSEGSWRQLGVELEDPGGLAVSSRLIAVTDRSADETFVWVSTDDGMTFSTYPTPCSPELDAGTLSVTVDSLWLACATGTAATVAVSTDAGATWSKADTGEPLPSANALALGARDPSAAVVAVPGAARQVGEANPNPVAVPGLDHPSFAGFTTSTVGYILDRDGDVFRTTNGGFTWTRVDVD